MVLVFLCASSVCVALASGWCDHESRSIEERFTTESFTTCEHDPTCIVMTTNTEYDVWCHTCRSYVGYGNDMYIMHSGDGEDCDPEFHRNMYLDD